MQVNGRDVSQHPQGQRDAKNDGSGLAQENPRAIELRGDAAQKINRAYGTTGIVTALEMPRLDGYELIARIRREATLRGLPIIVLSSRTSQPARDRALGAGADVFLPKGRHRRNLIEAVAACLRGGGERDGLARARE